MICSLQGNAESLSSFIHNKVWLTDWFGFNSTIPLPISLASISSVLTRECYYFQYVFRTCKKIIVNLDANRTLVKTCLELKGFSSNRFGKIMASVPTRMYICLFKHCLLNGGKWSSDLWPLVEDCWKQLGLVLCNLHLLSPFETGTKTKATKKKLFWSLITFLILVRAFYATPSIQSLALFIHFWTTFSLFKLLMGEGAGSSRHIKKTGKMPP